MTSRPGSGPPPPPRKPGRLLAREDDASDSFRSVAETKMASLRRGRIGIRGKRCCAAPESERLEPGCIYYVWTRRLSGVLMAAADRARPHCFVCRSGWPHCESLDEKTPGIGRLAIASGYWEDGGEMQRAPVCDERRRRRKCRNCTTRTISKAERRE